MFSPQQSEDDEFEHLQDEEEFENFDKEKGSTTKVKGGEKLPDLQMAKVWNSEATHVIGGVVLFVPISAQGLFLICAVSAE